MNKCIYLKTDKGQTFNKEEHVFPAGLGGIKKLPKGYVSDYVNESVFSPLELMVMRDSIVAIDRMFIGPGKRGKLNKKNETKSKVAIYTDDNDNKNISLGYIKKGKPYQISQLVVVKHEKMNYKIISDINKSEGNRVNKFIDFLKEFDDIKSLRKVNLYDKSLGKNEFIIGYHENKIYMLTNNKNLDFDYIQKTIKKVVEAYNANNYINNNSSIQPKIKLEMQFNIVDFYRVCAKIAFNYLASEKGQEYVLHERFDKLRNFILGKKDNINCNIIKEDLKNIISYPSESHKIFIQQQKEFMYAVISFYGRTNIYIELCTLCKDDFKSMLNIRGFSGFGGYICDWKSRVEYNLIEYIDIYNNYPEKLNSKEEQLGNIMIK